MMDRFAGKLDNLAFKTDRKNAARGALTDPAFTRFLARASDTPDNFDEAKLAEGKGDRELMEMHERFERVKTVSERAQNVLTKQLGEQMGVTIDPADLADVNEYFTTVAFEDPKSFERLAKTFERGIKLEADVAQRRGKVSALKQRFGEEKYDLMKMQNSGGLMSKMLGSNSESRVWAREEARKRQYGPVRSWMFSTFSANSAITEKVMEGSTGSVKKRRQAFAEILKAENKLEKADAHVRDALVARMLEQSDFANRAVEAAREKVLSEVRDVIHTPQNIPIAELVAKRAKLEEMADSNFVPEDGVLVAGSENIDTLLEQFELTVKYRVALELDSLMGKLADPNVDPGFAELRDQVADIAQSLSDGTPQGNKDARILVAEELKQKNTTALTTRRSVLVSLLINDLVR